MAVVENSVGGGYQGNGEGSRERAGRNLAGFARLPGIKLMNPAVVAAAEVD